MINDSRTALYEYLYDIFFDVVTKNVYMMREPQELTKSDTTEGFIVLHVGEMVDASEFNGNAYALARCFAEVFVPQMSRGRLDTARYSAFEDGINAAIRQAADAEGGVYHVHEDDIISLDAEETSNANNAYFVFIKSFVVQIDAQEN